MKLNVEPYSEQPKVQLVRDMKLFGSVLLSVVSAEVNEIRLLGIQYFFIKIYDMRYFSSVGLIPIWVYFNAGGQMHGSFLNLVGTTAPRLTRKF